MLAQGAKWESGAKRGSAINQNTVIPAKAGPQFYGLSSYKPNLGPRLRGDDAIDQSVHRRPCAGRDPISTIAEL